METLTLRTQEDTLVIPRDVLVVKSIFLNNIVQLRELVFKSEQERLYLCRFLFLMAAKDSIQNSKKTNAKTIDVSISPLAYCARELIHGGKQ